MNPMFSRIPTSALGLAPCSSSPLTFMLPCCTERSAPASVSTVVFPDPEGPVIITISPGQMSQVTSNKTWRRSAPAP
jgi:hypothetical protein